MHTLTVCRMLTVTRGAYDALAAAFPLSARQVLLNLRDRAQEARNCSRNSPAPGLSGLLGAEQQQVISRC